MKRNITLRSLFFFVMLFMPLSFFAMEEVALGEPLHEETELALKKAFLFAYVDLAELYLFAPHDKQDYEKALSFAIYVYEKKECAEARQKAAALLGEIYRFGCSQPRDYNKAYDYYSIAAEQSESPWAQALARMRLGAFYFSGYCFEKNPKKAFEYYSKAADQQANLYARVSAMLNLADMYRAGTDVPQDHEKAFQNYRFAHQYPEFIQIWPQATLYLAHCYKEGNGVVKDLVKARELYQAAADFQRPSVGIIAQKKLESSSSVQESHSVAQLAHSYAINDHAIIKEQGKTSNAVEEKDKELQEESSPLKNDALDAVGIEKERRNRKSNRVIKGPKRRPPENIRAAIRKNDFLDDPSSLLDLEEKNRESNTGSTPEKKVIGGVTPFGAAVTAELLKKIEKQNK